MLIQSTLLERPSADSLASSAMLADFSACGGVIMLATGLRICGIKIFPIAMLPALLLIMPVSAFVGAAVLLKRVGGTGSALSVATLEKESPIKPDGLSWVSAQGQDDKVSEPVCFRPG